MASLYTELDTERLSGAPATRLGLDAGRTAFQKDYARLIHAPTFRRLQGKTQLFPGHEDDFFRNRLTHSLEVAQVATGVASKVNANFRSRGVAEVDLDLVRFAALAHDLGHPPFGHNGEEALNELMHDCGGFEGNAQTLHILAAVESKLVKDATGQERSDFGLDLTYRSLASVLKYDSEIPLEVAGVTKGYYGAEASLVKAIKSKVAPNFVGAFKTIECAIMDVSDDIAYSTYDLEDSLHARFVTPAGLLYHLLVDEEINSSVYARVNSELAKSGHAALSGQSELVQKTISALGLSQTLQAGHNLVEADMDAEAKSVVDLVFRSCSTEKGFESNLRRTAFTAERVGRLIDAVEVAFNKEFPMLSPVRLTRDALIDVEVLKSLNYQLVIRSHRLAGPEARGKSIIQSIFSHLVKKGESLLPSPWREKYSQTKSDEARKRLICDYVAGMTDRYAVETYDAFFGSGKTIFKHR